MLQEDATPLPSVSMDADARLIPFMSEADINAVPQTSATSTRREGLTANAVMTCAGGPGASVAIAFTPPAPGSVGRVETVLWREIGVAGVRACAWIYQWLKLRKYKLACANCDVNPLQVQLWRDASVTFRALYDRVEASIKRYRVTDTEDTLHSLATGEIEARKESVNSATGEIVSLSQGAIYDTKAAALLLSALDPTRYGNSKGVSGQVAVAIQINIPPPAQRDTPERTVSATVEPEDADYCEA